MNIWQQDWISRWALYSPDRPAIHEQDSGNSITYAELNLKANGIAKYLKSQYQVDKGDRIAIIADFNIDYVALFAAAQKPDLLLCPLITDWHKLK